MTAAGRTISEKILARAAGRDARAGDLVVCEVDCVLGTLPMARDYFEAANRNFKGLMGNASASIYLASPASCAAAATRAVIVDPGEVSR